MQIEGKVVLITGASEGIGAACAAVFRQQGASLSLTARSAQKLEQQARPADLIVPADLLEPGSPQRIVEATIERFGRIDILINNAGAGLYTPSHSGAPELGRQLFDLNFFAPLELVRHAVPHMKRQGSGTIVNVSSIAGAVTLPWFTMYSATKAALIALTDGLRMELRRFGIHCMSVWPGYVRTNFQRNILAGDVPQSLGPLRNVWAITPEQCAAAIARGVRRNARTVVTPVSGHLMIAISRMFPSLLDRQLEAAWLRQSKEVTEGSR